MEKTKPKILIGCDPEFFLLNKDINFLISAHGLIPGTKDAPYPVRNGAVQLDGCAVEFNTRPTTSAKEFVKITKSVLAQIKKIVPKGHEFVFEPAVFFDKYYFSRGIPEKQKELGCTPDYNAWNELMNRSPGLSAASANMRTGSGHIHIGWTSGKDITDRSHRWDCFHIVRELDMTVGRFLHEWDKDTYRRNLYGNWGACRPKSYGVEWRVPSNKWLAHPEIWEWLFNAVKYVVEQSMTEGRTMQQIDPTTNYYPCVDQLAGFRNRTAVRNLADVRAYYPKFPELPKILNPEDRKTKAREEFNEGEAVWA